MMPLQTNAEEVSNDVPDNDNPRNNITVAIDAGHQLKGNTKLEPVGPGAKTKKMKVSYGTAGRWSKLAEYKLSLIIAKKLKKDLEKMGYNVYMVRTENDVNIPNSKRVKKALKADADILIHIHADSSSSSSVKGAHTIAQGKKNPYQKLYKQSSRLAKCVINSYCKATSIKKKYGGTTYRNDLTGINYSTIPTIFIEMGFMSNRSDDLYMSKKKNQTKMAQGIADGIDNYFKKYVFQ
jgi:N-acetylmuramoyl-L-alanine amidase